jgi:hypothetical protein
MRRRSTNTPNWAVRHRVAARRVGFDHQAHLNNRDRDEQPEVFVALIAGGLAVSNSRITEIKNLLA